MSIKFENTEVIGWEAAIRGMRNPMNSWERSDSGYKCPYLKPEVGHTPSCCRENMCIGPNDLDLMKRLAAGGPVHAKYRRYIVVYVDITAPIYWWTEFDTYRTGVTPNPMDIEMNSTSTMHKIHAKEFTIDDFSHEHLDGVSRDMFRQNDDNQPYFFCSFEDMLYIQIEVLNRARKLYLETKDKKYWWQMIQLLPNSYHYRRTVMMNYEVLSHIYKSRKDHKLDEWAEHTESTCTVDTNGDCENPKEYLLCEDCFVKKGFCDWIKTLPYSELITGRFHETNDSEVAK